MNRSFLRKLAYFALVLVMVTAIVPLFASNAKAADEYTGTGTFEKHTGELTSGYYVFGGGSTTSVSAINNTVGTSWIKFTATTPTDNNIVNPDTSIVWYYDAAAGTFKNGDNYIYWPTTGNTGGVGTKNTPLTVTETTTAGVYNITVTATPARYLRLNGTSGYRFYESATGTNTFYFFRLDETTLPDASCVHTNTVAIGEAKEANCTENGITAGSKCNDCGAIVEAQETIPATGHNYVNGTCSVCDEKQPTELIFNRDAFGEASGYAWHAWTATTTKGDIISGSGYIYGSTKESIQMNAKDGKANYIYNTTPLPGNITSVKLTAFKTTYRGFVVLTSDTPFDSATDNRLTPTEATVIVDNTGATWEFDTNHKYFAIILADDEGAAYLSSIEIEYYICPHTNTTAIGEAKAATCIEDGITAGEKCSVCGEVITAQETIEALGHTEPNAEGKCDTCGASLCTEHVWIDGDVITEGDCTTNRVVAQVCQNCNEPGEDKITTAPGHTKEVDAAVAATCTTTGLTEGSHCSVCNEVIVAQEEVPATGHKYENGACSVCGESVPLSYTFDYTTIGYTTDTSLDGAREGLLTLTFAKGTNNNNAPKWYFSDTTLRFYTNNTLTISTESGYYIESITLTLERGEFSADSGTITDNVWSSDNKETTTVIFTNTTNARVEKIEIKLAAICNHTNTEAIGEDKDATCTEAGSKAGEKCSDCGEEITAQETIDALGHIDEDSDNICDRCEANLCTAHDFSVEYIITEATCTKDGELGYKCSACGEIDTNTSVISATGHSFVNGYCEKCNASSVLADFEFGTDGGSGEGNSAISAGVIETSNGYELNFTTATNVYDKAWDAKGNAALKLGSSSNAGVFEFTVPDDVKTVVIYVAGRQTKTVGITVNGTPYNIETLSDNGEYTKVVVDTTENKTVNLKTTTNYRAYVNSIEFLAEEIAEPIIKSVSLTLNKGVMVNVKYYITENWLILNSGAKVVFSNGESFDVKEGLNTYSVQLTPGQINALLKVGINEIDDSSIEVSVAEYTKKVTESNATTMGISADKYNALVALLEKIIAYGDAANATSGSLVEESFEGVGEQTINEGNGILGTISATLSEQANVKYSVNSSSIPGATVVVTFNGEEKANGALASYLNSEGQLVINNICPADFDKTIVITITNGETVVASAEFTFNQYLKALYATYKESAVLTANMAAAAYQYGLATKTFADAE